MERLNSCHTEQQDTGIDVRSYKNDSLHFPNVVKPQAVGYFSLTTNRDYEPDAQNLQYYKPPKKFPFDLNEGYAKRIQKPETTKYERLNSLLHFIYDNRNKLINGGGNCTQLAVASEFICLRGLLRLIMCTPYEYRSDWRVHITKFKGNFYLCKKETAQGEFERLNETETQKRMSSWGFKFEQHCLSKSPHHDPNTGAPVDECSEFLCVFKTKIEGIDLLYAAEMDGILSEHTVDIEEKDVLNNLRFVELKVTLSQHRLNNRQRESFSRFKCRNWWSQCFLVGIKDIYMGSRDENGKVEKIDYLDVRSLPKQAMGFWSPTGCMHFLIQFIETVKVIMQDVNCPYTVFDFYFDPKVSKITFQCFSEKTIHSFLPDWYISKIQQLTNGTFKH